MTSLYLIQKFNYKTSRHQPCKAKSMMLGSRASTSEWTSLWTLKISAGCCWCCGGGGCLMRSGTGWSGGVWAGAGDVGAIRGWVWSCSWSWWWTVRHCRDKTGWGGGSWGSSGLRLQLSGRSVISLSNSSEKGHERNVRDSGKKKSVKSNAIDP